MKFLFQEQGQAELRGDTVLPIGDHILAGPLLHLCCVWTCGRKWKHSRAYSTRTTARTWWWKTPNAKGIIKVILNSLSSNGQLWDHRTHVRLDAGESPLLLQHCDLLVLSQALRSSVPTLTPAPDVVLREYPGNWRPTECIISSY